MKDAAGSLSVVGSPASSLRDGAGSLSVVASPAGSLRDVAGSLSFVASSLRGAAGSLRQLEMQQASNQPGRCSRKLKRSSKPSRQLKRCS